MRLSRRSRLDLLQGRGALPFARPASRVTPGGEVVEPGAWADTASIGVSPWRLGRPPTNHHEGAGHATRQEISASRDFACGGFAAGLGSMLGRAASIGTNRPELPGRLLLRERRLLLSRATAGLRRAPTCL